MNRRRSLPAKAIVFVFAALITALVAACGGGTVQGGGVSGGTGTGASSYTVGGSVTGLSGTGLVLQDNGGDNLTVAVNGPFTFATAVASGNPYSITVFTQPSGQTCTITGGSGTVLATVTSVAVNCVNSLTPRYAFTTNWIDNSVSTYVMDGTTGRLKYIGKVLAGVSPQSIATDPLGKYAYVANSGNNIVTQYTVGANGVLTAMATPPSVTVGSSPVFVTVDPTGKYVYVANSGSANISQFTITPSGVLAGNLVPMTVATVAAGTTPVSVTVDPSGMYAYVANSGSGNISQYTIGTGGALTPMMTAQVAAGTAPKSVTIDPSGKYAYVANSASATISQYTISASGSLVPMSPATVATGTNPVFVTVDPTGKYAYVANNFNGPGGNSVSQYTIGAGGMLTPMTPTTVATGTSPTFISVDPSGRYAYVSNDFNGAGGNSVSQYSIGAGGALMPLAPASVPDMLSPSSIAITAGTTAVQAVPQYAYVTDFGSNTISQYTLGAGGALSPMATATIAAASAPIAIATDPAGTYAYVANNLNGTGGNSVSQLNVATNGTLSMFGSVAAGTSPAAVTVDPSGKYVYVVNSGSNNISQYTASLMGPMPMFPATVSTGTNPLAISIDPSGRYAYVANQTSNNVSQYTIAANGSLTPMTTATVAAGTGPFSVIVDPSGQYAYVANQASGKFSQYNISANGALTPMATATVAAGTAPYAVAIDPSGKHAYVANFASNNVSQYTIGANGALTSMAPATVAAGTAPYSVTVDPSGKYVYVANKVSGNVSQYTIGAGGALSPMATPAVSAGGGATSVTTTGTWQ